MAEIEATEMSEGRTIHLRPPSPGDSALHWIPIARGQFVDAPVACTNGISYYALPFDFALDKQVRTLISAYRSRGRRSATVADIDAAIERLQTYRSEIASLTS